MAEATANLRLGLIDDGLVKGVSNISTQLTNLQLASTAVGAGLPLLEKGLKSNASQYLVGAKNAKLLANNLGDLIEYNKQLGNVLGKASNVAFYAQQLATLAKGAADAYRSLKRIPETLEQMERSGVSTGSIQGFTQLRDAIGGSQAAVESFAQVAVSKLNAVEQASARVGTILKSSTNFNEQGIAKRANAQDLGQNRKQLQELLRGKLDNTVTSTEALLGQYEVLSGGFTSSKASQQVLDPGLKLIGIAKAGGQAADPTATLQLLTKTLRAYGLEASQATRVSAILNSTVENGITTIQELSMTFGQASQVAKTAGISIEDLAAATSVLTAQGTSTPVALTGIQALARNIIDKTPEATKELAKLRDAQGNRIRLDIREVQQKGLVKVVQDLFQATGGNQELLAKILPDSLAYRTALGLYSNKGQDFANVSASVKANANAQSLNEVFDTATGDRISRFQKIANRFEETIIQIGESLAPIFEPGIAYLEKISKLIASIPDPVKKAIGSYLSFQIQSKAISTAFGQLSGAVVSVLGNFALLRVINLVLTGQFGKEVAVIKELILQKKGLGAVIKQLVGLNQSHLLSTQAATGAIAKEGIIQKTVNAVREKTNEVIKKNVQGYVAQNEAVGKAGQAVTGIKGKFLEFIGVVKSTTIGEKIDGITSRFSKQKEAVQELISKISEYFKGVKNGVESDATTQGRPPIPAESALTLYRGSPLAVVGTKTSTLARTKEFYESQSLIGDNIKKANLLQSVFLSVGSTFALVGDKIGRTVTGIKGKILELATAIKSINLTKGFENLNSIFNSQKEILLGLIQRLKLYILTLKDKAIEGFKTFWQNAQNRGKTQSVQIEVIDQFKDIQRNVQSAKSRYLDNLKSASADGIVGSLPSSSELARSQKSFAEQEKDYFNNLRSANVDDFTLAQQKQTRALLGSGEAASQSSKRFGFLQSAINKVAASFILLGDKAKLAFTGIQAGLLKFTSVFTGLNIGGRLSKGFEGVTTVFNKQKELFNDLNQRAKSYIGNLKDLIVDKIPGFKKAQQSQAITRQNNVFDLTNGRQIGSYVDLDNLRNADINGSRRRLGSSADLARRQKSFGDQERDYFNNLRSANADDLTLAEKAQAKLLALSSQATNTITEQFRRFKKGISDQLEAIAFAFNNLGSNLKQATRTLVDLPNKLLTSTSNKLKAFQTSISNLGSYSLEMLVEKSKQKFESFKDLPRQLVASISSQTRGFKNSLDGFFGNVGGVIESAGVKARKGFQSLLGFPNQLLTQSSKQLVSFQSLSNAVVYGFELMGAKAKESFQSLARISNQMLVQVSRPFELLKTSVLGIGVAFQSMRTRVNQGIGVLVGGTRKGTTEATKDISLLRATIDGLGFAAGLAGKGIKSGLSFLGGFAKEAIIALGPIVPIGLAIGAAFALAGKELQHLFGGGAANELSRGLQGILDKMKELEEKSGKDGALLALKNDLANFAETGVSKIAIPDRQLKTIQKEVSGSIEEGFLDRIRNTVAIPFEKIGELTEFVGKKTGEIVNNTLNPIEKVAILSDLSPFQSRLEQLRNEGKLTQGQFNAMGDAFRKAGEDGKVTAEELSVLQNQIESFRAGAPGQIEEGVIDKIKSTLSLEGLGRLTNYIGNTAGAAVKNILNPFGKFTTAEDINIEREADKLLKPLSELRDVLDKVGDASFLSAEKTKKLTQGIFLTQQARELAAKGSQIQGTALEIENKATDEQIAKNETLITGYQEQAKTIQDNLKNTTSPELKKQLEEQFAAAQTQVDNLQKRSENLKQAREAIIKYYNEILPVLQQTILQSAVNPVDTQNALNDSFEVFKEKYVDEGKNFLKDVQQQRTEAQAVLDQTLQNYDRNLLGTAEAGERIKKVLDDSYISVTKDGKQVKGSIFDIDTQKNLVNQISQFNSQATTERLTQIDLESSKVAASGQFRLASEEDVVKKTTELQKEKLNLQKAQIEEEIKLRIQYGIKTTDLENKLQQTILEIDQVNFNEREKLIQKELEKRLQLIEVQRSEVSMGTATRMLSEENAQKEIARLQIEESKLKADELKRQLDEYEANGVKNVQLENQYAIARNQIREAEAKEKERLIQQELQQRTQALEIEKNQSQVLAEEGKLGQEDLSAEIAKASVEQARLKEQDLARQVQQLRASGQTSVSLEQEYTQARLQVRSLEAKEKERLIQQELQQKIKGLDLEQAEIEAKVSERSISEKDGQTAISQVRIEQEKLRLADLERQLRKLRNSGGKSVALEQEASAARLRIRKMEADEKNRLEDLAFETQKKRLELENQRAGLRRQQLDAEYEALQKQSQLIEAITNSRNQLADTESRYVQNQLQNQAKLTRDPLKQAEIELRILSEREVDLARTQKAELESLAIRQKLAAIDLQRQQIQIQTQKLELESQAKILEIELKRAISQKRSPEEIEAMRLQIQGNKQRTDSLNQQLKITGQQIDQQGEINSNEQKRVRLNQQIEAENIKVEKTLLRQKVLHEQIDRVARDFSLAQQKLQQEYNKQTATLENQSTILGFQKQLIEARQKAFDDKLNFATSELNLASQLIVKDKQRQVLAQAAATIKLKALDEQQKAEREVLLLNQQQAKVQQQIEAIKLRGQQAQNKADTAQAYADLLKLKASGATQEEVYAGEMNLSAKLQAGQALGLQASLLPLQGQLLDFNQQQELINLDNKQRLDRLQAKSELVSTLPDGYQKDKYKQQIINELLSDVYGKKVTDWNYTSALDQIQRDNNSDLRRLMTGKEQQQTMRGRSGSVYIDYGAPPKVQGLDISSSRLDDISNQLKNLSEPVVPNLQLGFPSAPNTNIGNTEVTRFQQTAERVENTVKMEIGGINISVHSSEDAGKKMEQEILNTLDRVMVEAKRRL